MAQKATIYKVELSVSDMDRHYYETHTVSSVVMVTFRRPNDGLYHDVLASVDGDFDKLPFSLKRIGDCEAPAIIAAATYAGHKYARELDTPIDPDEPLLHDRVDVGER